jgi:uracil-DNA glycosylase
LATILLLPFLGHSRDHDAEMARDHSVTQLKAEIGQFTICAARFADTTTAHSPRPIVWFNKNPPILIAGQAPGIRVHEDGKPFWDRSGDRLREWMGIDKQQFYDDRLVSILPTAFCFPGYNAKGSDLPPPRICWETWHDRCLRELGKIGLRLIIGKHAIERHLGERSPLTQVVENWQSYAPSTFVLPHPSWRNNTWIKKHPWFERDLIPELQATVARVIAHKST